MKHCIFALEGGLMRILIGLEKMVIFQYIIFENVTNVNLIHVITYFSFVKNVSLKQEMCAESNAT